jgi:hypothetical protein
MWPLADTCWPVSGSSSGAGDARARGKRVQGSEQEENGKQETHGAAA